MATVEREGGSLYYEVHDLTPPWLGEPETIVFHHGVGTDAGIWSAWLPVLASRYRLVRFDMRGFGRSHVPGPGFEWSFDLLAGDVLAVAKAASAERFHLVGESLGGTVAMALAARQPGVLRSLTTCSASHRGGSIQRVQHWRAFIAQNGVEAWSREMMALRFAKGAVAADVAEWFHRTQSACSADSVLDLADLLIGTDLSPELPAISCPTLLLAPDASPFVPLALPVEIRERIPGAELMVFPGARHGLACSHGRACAEALRDFLARRAGA